MQFQRSRVQLPEMTAEPMHWTGGDAAALQSAMRLTNEMFADRLHVSVRAVAAWHAKATMRPRADMQLALDGLLSRATPAEQDRFRKLSQTVNGGSDPAKWAETLTTAIAIVVHNASVLVVCRRSDTAVSHWQFPAGIVKPGSSIERTAERETLAETGVRCAAARDLGARIHPVTNVLCRYVSCEYLGGEPANLDPVENTDATWAPIDRLSKFIPLNVIYPPVVEALRGLAT